MKNKTKITGLVFFRESLEMCPILQNVVLRLLNEKYILDTDMITHAGAVVLKVSYVTILPVDNDDRY